MAGLLRDLAAAAARLPPAHLVGSFLLSVVAGLLIGGSIGGGGADGNEKGSRTPASRQEGTGKETEDGPELVLSAAQSSGQLVVQPVRVDEEADFLEAASEIRRGRAGAALLYLPDDAGSGPRASMTKQHVQQLSSAARAASLPPPLVIVALEGIGSDGSYCADTIPGARKQLALALRPAAGRQPSVALGKTIAGAGANAVLSTSFKDPGEGCVGGRKTGVSDHVEGLAEGGVMLFARGAQGWRAGHPDAAEFAQRYQTARRSQLRLLAMSRKPEERRAWRTRAQVAAARSGDSDTLLIGTPDLGVAGDDPGAAPTVTGRIEQALVAGADIPLFTLAGDLGGRAAAARAVRKWFRAHPDRLLDSCARMLELKSKWLESNFSSRACRG